MRKAKRSLLNYKKLITRTIIIGILLLLSIISLCISPKRILNDEFIYKLAIDNTIINDKDDIAFIRYKVYVNEEKYNKNAKNDIDKAIQKFVEEQRVLVVKIPGLTKKETRMDNYILIEDPEVPELNIEFYSAKYARFGNNTAPVESFISAAMDISKKANQIYLPSLIVLHGTLIAIFSIKEYGYISEIIKRKKKVD